MINAHASSVLMYGKYAISMFLVSIGYVLMYAIAMFIIFSMIYTHVCKFMFMFWHDLCSFVR